MASPLSIVFCGTPLFAVPSLRALIGDPSFSVKLVVTQPDKPVGRKQILTAPPVKDLADQSGIPVLQSEDLNRETAAIRKLNPDFLVVAAYGKILSPDILAIPSIAPVNLHPSLLPRWRGASPVHHAILAGDRETGVTIQKMAEALDAGHILAQERFALPPNETAGHLLAALAEKGATLLCKTLKEPLHPIPQNEQGVTFCSKLTRKNGEAAPARETAEAIDRKVRALTPWPGVTASIKGETVKILKTSLKEVPGAFRLPCASDTSLFILELQSPGKKPMAGAAWSRGRR